MPDARPTKDPPATTMPTTTTPPPPPDPIIAAIITSLPSTPSPDIFLDFASQDSLPFGITSLKTRLALNLKSHPYTTRFLLYPQISPLLSSPPISLPAHHTPRATAAHTLPTARVNGIWVTDSLAIAEALEDAYPGPRSLRVREQRELVGRVEALIREIATPLVAVFLPVACGRLLPEASAQYVRRTREPVLGKIEELEEKARVGSEGMWRAAEDHGRELAALVRSGWEGKGAEGPFFEGAVLGYADLVVVGFLWCARRHGEEFFERMVDWDREVYGGLWKAAEGLGLMEKVD